MQVDKTETGHIGPVIGFGKFPIKNTANQTHDSEGESQFEKIAWFKFLEKVFIADNHQKHIGNGFGNHQGT